MQVGRRQFLKYCLGSAAALGLPLSVVGSLEKAYAAVNDGLPTVIWLYGANCSGCTVSLANLISNDGPADVADLLINTINLAFHPTLMGATGDLAVENLNRAADGDFILVVEGGIPTAFNGHACVVWTDANGHEVTGVEAVQTLAPKAAAVLSVGTCASYGGIPGGDPNPSQVRSVSAVSGLNTINIPGCPTHPDWIVWTVAHLLAGQIPTLDSQGRPRELFNAGGRESIHKICPRKERDEAKSFCDVGMCLEELGCQGEEVRADCPIRKWNNQSSWCIGAGTLCIACTERDFPDEYSPFYKLEYSYDHYDKPVEEPPPMPLAPRAPSGITLKIG